MSLEIGLQIMTMVVALAGLLGTGKLILWRLAQLEAKFDNGINAKIDSLDERVIRMEAQFQATYKNKKGAGHG